MPRRAFVLRFPNGDFEYDLTRSAVPGVGETIRRGESLWSVRRVTHEEVPTAYVELVKGPAPDQPRGFARAADADDGMNQFED